MWSSFRRKFIGSYDRVLKRIYHRELILSRKKWISTAITSIISSSWATNRVLSEFKFQRWSLSWLSKNHLIYVNIKEVSPFKSVNEAFYFNQSVIGWISKTRKTQTAVRWACDIKTLWNPIWEVEWEIVMKINPHQNWYPDMRKPGWMVFRCNFSSIFIRLWKFRNLKIALIRYMRNVDPI